MAVIIEKTAKTSSNEAAILNEITEAAKLYQAVGLWLGRQILFGNLTDNAEVERVVGQAWVFLKEKRRPSQLPKDDTRWVGQTRRDLGFKKIEPQEQQAQVEHWEKRLAGMAMDAYPEVWTDYKEHPAFNLEAEREKAKLHLLWADEQVAWRDDLQVLHEPRIAAIVTALDLIPDDQLGVNDLTQFRNALLELVRNGTIVSGTAEFGQLQTAVMIINNQIGEVRRLESGVVSRSEVFGRVKRGAVEVASNPGLAKQWIREEMAELERRKEPMKYSQFDYSDLTQDIAALLTIGQQAGGGTIPDVWRRLHDELLEELEARENLDIQFKVIEASKETIKAIVESSRNIPPKSFNTLINAPDLQVAEAMAFYSQIAPRVLDPRFAETLGWTELLEKDGQGGISRDAAGQPRFNSKYSQSKERLTIYAYMRNNEQKYRDVRNYVANQQVDIIIPGVHTVRKRIGKESEELGWRFMFIGLSNFKWDPYVKIDPGPNEPRDLLMYVDTARMNKLFFPGQANQREVGPRYTVGAYFADEGFLAAKTLTSVDATGGDPRNWNEKFVQLRRGKTSKPAVVIKEGAKYKEQLIGDLYDSITISEIDQMELNPNMTAEQVNALPDVTKRLSDYVDRNGNWAPRKVPWLKLSEVFYDFTYIGFWMGRHAAVIGNELQKVDHKREEMLTPETYRALANSWKWLLFCSPQFNAPLPANPASNTPAESIEDWKKRRIIQLYELKKAWLVGVISRHTPAYAGPADELWVKETVRKMTDMAKQGGLLNGDYKGQTNIEIMDTFYAGGIRNTPI